MGHEYTFPPHRPNVGYVIEKEAVASIKLIGATAPERPRIGVNRVGFWHTPGRLAAGHEPQLSTGEARSGTGRDRREE
jgi:hypothetical protein